MQKALFILILVLPFCQKGGNLALEMGELSAALCRKEAVVAIENGRRQLTARLSQLLLDEHNRRVVLEESQYQKIMVDFTLTLKDCQVSAELREFEDLLMQEPTMQKLIAEIARGLQQVLREH
ncbi:MAG: hypothetical protein HS115_19315 [Spirochaetales bacterium]|nr:hypothetical protein [Spirochaetales bacterium]